MQNHTQEDTIREFEKSFQEREYYNKQTRDDDHRDMLLSSLHIYGPSNVLDFGTGSGYLSFALAKKQREVMVTGIDIVANTLKANERAAQEEKLKNLAFVSYDGGLLPFENNSFDAVMSRYVMHHVENMQDILYEVNRVLTPGGQLLIADPSPNTKDNLRFIDQYMKLKQDGHIMFYTREEMIHMANMAGLVYEASRYTKIRFPKKKTEEVMRLLDSTEESIKSLYQIEITDSEVYVSVDVLNISFFKG